MYLFALCVVAAGVAIAIAVRSNARARETIAAHAIETKKQRRLATAREEAQQLESIGRLAAGVAHEINTPTQFTADSLQFVREALAELADAIRRHPEARAALAADETADLDYVLANVPLALDRADSGLDRITTIVKSLRELALPDQQSRTSIDLNDVIEESIVAARAELDCTIVAKLVELPVVVGTRAELYRVFMNILGNAARSISDTKITGAITVTTRSEGDCAVIAIADTGTGIPEAIRHLVFQPFFTTREVGKARGQGLAVSRAAVARHGGSLAFETECGVGTTFTIRLPFAANGKRVGVAA